MKWCPRCNLRPASTGELCGACHVTVTLNKTKADTITDEEIIEMVEGGDYEDHDHVYDEWYRFG